MRRIIILLMLISFILPGCSFFNRSKVEPERPKVTEKSPAEKESASNSKDYYIGLDTPVAGVKDWVTRYRPYEGVFLQKHGSYRFLLISMGEQFTGGYQVNLDKVSKANGKWLVEVSFKVPGSDKTTTQNINYPYQVVTIRDDNNPIEVFRVTEKNVKIQMKTIEIPEGRQLAVSKSFIVFTPLAGDKIISPVKISGKARVFEANFRISVEDGHFRLAQKTVMADQGAPGWGNFDLSLPFDKFTNPNGSIIFSYENMKNGKMIEELPLSVKF